MSARASSRWSAGRPWWAPRASVPGRKHTRWSWNWRVFSPLSQRGSHRPAPCPPLDWPHYRPSTRVSTGADKLVEGHPRPGDANTDLSLPQPVKHQWSTSCRGKEVGKGSRPWSTEGGPSWGEGSDGGRRAGPWQEGREGEESGQPSPRLPVTPHTPWPHSLFSRRPDSEPGHQGSARAAPAPRACSPSWR